MTYKRKLVLTVAAMALSAGVAMASPVTDTIVSDLIAAGYSKIEVKVGLLKIKVEAESPGGDLERVYTLDGVLIKEEITEGGVKTETIYAEDGTILSQEISEDDHDEIDDDEDDHDEIDDDDDDDGEVDDDDHDDDDHEDKDEDDDHDDSDDGDDD